MCCRHAPPRRQMGFQWGNWEVFFPWWYREPVQAQKQNIMTLFKWNVVSRENSLQMKEQGQLPGELGGLLWSSLPEPPSGHREDSLQGWCNLTAWVMGGKECSATPQLLLPHGRSSDVPGPKFTHLAETTTAIPSSTSSSVLALIFTKPSLI